MTPRIIVLAIAMLGALVLSAPAHLHGQQAVDTQQHDQHHPAGPATATPQAGMPMGDMAGMMARMRANDAKLDELVKKMQAAKGAAKTDAVAELLAALVDERKNTCEPMMAHMMSMMNGMGGSGRMGNPPTTPAR